MRTIMAYESLEEALKEQNKGSKPGQNYYEPEVPALPNWTNKIMAYTDKQADKIYQVNLFHLTCSCEDYKINKLNYKARDIRILCKHLYYKLTYSAAEQCISPMIKLLIKSACIFKEEYLYKYEWRNRTYIIGFKEDTEWVNCYLGYNNEFTQYSYSTIDDRWSRKRMPEEHIVFGMFIREVIQYQLPYVHVKQKINTLIKQYK